MTAAAMTCCKCMKYTVKHISQLFVLNQEFVVLLFTVGLFTNRRCFVLNDILKNQSNHGATAIL